MADESVHKISSGINQKFDVIVLLKFELTSRQSKTLASPPPTHTCKCVCVCVWKHTDLNLILKKLYNFRRFTDSTFIIFLFSDVFLCKSFREFTINTCRCNALNILFGFLCKKIYGRGEMPMCVILASWGKCFGPMQN